MNLECSWKTQNDQCWKKKLRRTKPALTLFTYFFPLSLLLINSFQLPNEHRCLLIDSNSKTISGVAKTTQLMICSLLILKTSGMSRGIVWALSYLTSKSLHLFPLLPPTCPPTTHSLSCLLPIITVIIWSDEGRGMHSGGITMWVNFNSLLSSLHIHQIPPMLYLDQPICYTQGFFFLVCKRC